MRYLFTILLFFSPFYALSQSNYHTGSVTTNDGQVNSGYINYREWEYNPKYIEFKKSLDIKAPDIIYPTAVKFFVIDDMEKYIKYSGPVSMNHINFPDLPLAPDTSFMIDNIYLKQVATGDNLSLYTYTDSVKTRFFVQEKQEQPYELSYQQYYDETGTSTRQSKRYVGQLSYLVTKYANANSSLSYKLEKLGYDNGIEDIVNSINDSKKTGRKQLSYTRFYWGAGLNITTSRFEGATDFGTADNPSYSPKLSLGIDLFNNPNVQRFILRTELSFSYASPTFAGTQYSFSTSGTSRQIYTYNQYNITITPQLIWNLYNKDAFKVYLDIGIAFNFSKYTNNKLGIVGGYNLSLPAYDLANYWTNFPTQVGVVLNKRIEIFASRSAPASFSHYAFYSIGSEIYSTGVHYLLSKTKK